MFVTRVITALVLSTAVCAGASHAQAVPSEFPPSSFSGKQYVDSAGCAFIRAGNGPTATWYPRINQKRKQICGQNPTFAAARTPKAAPAPKPAPTRVASAPAVRVATPKPATPKPIRPKPAKPTRVVAPRRIVKAPMATVASTIAAPRIAPRAPVVVAPVAPRRIAAAPAAAPAPASRRPSQNMTTPCTSGTSKYTTGGRTYTIRCGPQALSPSGGKVMRGTVSSPVPYVRTTTAVQAVPRTLTGTPRVIRYVRPVPTKITPPKGYVNAWTDGRLNPNRGIGTLTGRAQMDLIWTQTVPRKLIDQRRGIEVTQYYPTVRYPLIPSYGYTIPATAAHPAVTRTRITPKAATAPRMAKPASHRYVQVATFAGPKGASQAIARLQRQGITARIHTGKRGNQTLNVVLAGPFKTQSALNRALSAARRAGYSSAALIK